MTALITTAQVGAIGWICLAWAFLVAAVGIPLIRKARARGKRLFADEPTARVRALHQDTTHAHEQDAVL